MALYLALGPGGGHDKQRSGTGVPEELTHDGARVLAKSASGTSCCGFTFAVAMRALAAGDALRGKSVADVRALQKARYGATKVSAERQRAPALKGHDAALRRAHERQGQCATRSPARGSPSRGDLRRSPR